MQAGSPTAAGSLRRHVIPAAFLAGLWWLLSDGDQTSWLVGIPAIALALILSRQMTADSTDRQLKLLGLLRFTAYFMVESVRGGLDVARRILSPEVGVRPGLKEYHCRLTDRRACLLFANCVSLLPGTLAAELRQDCLIIHQIDATQDTQAELQRLEQAIAGIFTTTAENNRKNP